VSEPLPSPADLRAAAARLPRLPAPPADLTGPLAVGLSGGADSVLVLGALWADEAVRPRLRAWHFDHRVRGEASTADAAFCAAVCAGLGVPFTCGERRVPGPASEAALRLERDAFFRAERAAQAVRLLVTAHHVDDQVETLLMRLSQGAGPVGLSAPRERQSFRDGHVRWRPLLAAGWRKADVLQALRQAGLPWREDATNAEDVARRNRVRAWLATGAEAALGEGYALGFARAARIQGDLAEALLAWGAQLGAQVDAEGRLAVAGLRGAPPALLRLVVDDYLRGQGVREASSESLAPLLAAIGAGGALRVSIAGEVLRLQDGRLACERPAPGLGAHTRSLHPGEDAGGLAIEEVTVDASLWASLSRGEIPPEREVYLRAPAEPLRWRGRLAGDRYQPLGAPGSAKVSDLLINRKVPAGLRDALPVVLAGDEIIWVPGLPPADSHRLTGPAKGALRLTWNASRVGSTLPA
jgi:tRNA(Ile)-lysidine synthase